MPVHDLGRSWPLEAIALTLHGRRATEHDVEIALGRELVARGAVVRHQLRWDSGIPDIVATSSVPILGYRSLTVIEVKLEPAGSRAMAQIGRYMDEALRLVEALPEDWVVQGAIAAPGLRVPEAAWPRWFTYMPIRIHVPAARAA